MYNHTWLYWDILTLIVKEWSTHQPFALFSVPQICLHQCCKEGQAEVQSCESPIFWAGGSWRNRCSKYGFGFPPLSLARINLAIEVSIRAFWQWMPLWRSWSRRILVLWVSGYWGEKSVWHPERIGREGKQHIDSLWIFMVLREISVHSTIAYTQGECSINIFWLLGRSREEVMVLWRPREQVAGEIELSWNLSGPAIPHLDWRRLHWWVAAYKK